MSADDMYDQAAQAEFNQTRREFDHIDLRWKPMTAGDRDVVMRAAARMRKAAELLANPTPEERCERYDLPVNGCDHCRRELARVHEGHRRQLDAGRGRGWCSR